MQHQTTVGRRVSPDACSVNPRSVSSHLGLHQVAVDQRLQAGGITHTLYARADVKTKRIKNSPNYRCQPTRTWHYHDKNPNSTHEVGKTNLNRSAFTHRMLIRRPLCRRAWSRPETTYTAEQEKIRDKRRGGVGGHTSSGALPAVPRVSTNTRRSACFCTTRGKTLFSLWSLHSLRSERYRLGGNKPLATASRQPRQKDTTHHRDHIICCTKTGTAPTAPLLEPKHKTCTIRNRNTTFGVEFCWSNEATPRSCSCVFPLPLSPTHGRS